VEEKNKQGVRGSQEGEEEEKTEAIKTELYFCIL
jgi:hypothetical protein